MKQILVMSATQQNIKKLERLIRKAKDAYYIKSDFYTANRDEFPQEFLDKYAQKIGRKKYIEITDSVYDKLEDLMRKLDPNNAVLKLVGPSSDKQIKKKVKLPYPMGSLDKITPGSGSVASWKRSHPGPYLISDKEDGASLEVIFVRGENTKAYTRGRDGITGGDVSFMVPHLKIPRFKGTLAVRGEIAMKESVFKAKWSKVQKNARNMASGLLNRQDIQPGHKDLDFIVHEVLDPRGKPSQQLAKLKSLGFHVVPNKVFADIDEDMLSELLSKRKQRSAHEIDGLVVTQDKANPLTRSGNPSYAIAFKDEGAQESARAKVVAIEWEETRHGYLAPRIRIRPIKLRGVTVNFASGKNAGFIKKNRIGPGAVVRIRRAGDVIPDLKDGDVIEGATPTWPSRTKFGDWEWTDSGVNIKLKANNSHKHNDTVASKVIEHFFVSIGVEGFKQSTIEKYVAEGYRSVRDILAMSERRFTSLEGTTKTINKVYQEIRDCIDGVELPVLMDASNIFGRGMGTTRLRAIVKAYPNIMSMAGKDIDYLTDLIDELPGFDQKTGEQFASNLKRFAKWAKSVPQIKWELPKAKKLKSNSLAGVSVIMTGFRDQELSDAIEANGGQMVSTVRRATHLLVKDPSSTSAKTNQAKSLGIKIMTPESFRRKFQL